MFGFLKRLFCKKEVIAKKELPSSEYAYADSLDFMDSFEEYYDPRYCEEHSVSYDDVHDFDRD